MKAINKINRLPRFGRVGVPKSQRRLSGIIVVGSLTVLATALALNQVIPSGSRKLEVDTKMEVATPLFLSQTPSTCLADPTDQFAISADPQSVHVYPSVDDEKEKDRENDIIQDFLLNGLEFAVAGLEASSTLGPVRQMWNSVSEIAKTISLSEDVPQEETGNTIFVSDRCSSAPEREVAVWFLQNVAWTR